MESVINSSREIVFSDLPANSPLHRTLMILIFIPLVCLTVFGNALVIMAFRRDSTLRKPHYYILTSLALADLLNNSIAVPIELFSRIIQNEITCSRVKSGFFSIGQFVFCALSMTHLILVSSDRLIALLRPLRYVAIVTTTRVLFVISILWVACVSYGIVYLVDIANDSDDGSFVQFCSGMRYTDASNRRFYTATGVCILVLGAVLLIINLRILRIALRQVKRVRQCPRPIVIQVVEAKDEVREKDSEIGDHRRELREHFRKMKATRTVLLVVGLFCIGWFPACAWFIIRTRVDISHVGQILIFEIVFFFTTLSSTANPFIYCFKDVLFRRAFCRIIPSLRRYIRSVGDVEDTCG